jgi:hypothetical protein
VSPELISTLGLLLCTAPALVHGPEVVSPMLSRIVVNFILPFFGPGLPHPRIGLHRAEQLAMLDAARAATPETKRAAADDDVFLVLFEQRQGSLALVAA